MHTALADAYLQKVFDLGPGPLQALYSQKTDAAFDRALELDDGHWEARFGKALALSNWPSFQGKSGEAIHNFEVLLEQQETRPVEDRFEDTYFFLGNMYREAGDADKAMDVWRKGRDLFPGSERLAEQIATGEREEGR